MTKKPLISEKTLVDDEAEPATLFAEPRFVTDVDDCLFYHTMDIPGYGTVPGFWDLRDHESEYLGGVEFKNKRVLEIGPASGHLSFFIERAGAEVVSIEPASDHTWNFYWDIPEKIPPNLAPTMKEFARSNEEFKNSYWLAHRVFGSKAKVHYGSAYAIPAELGAFDISTLACVLLHNRNPLAILENCARITRETLIVVEPFRETQLSQSHLEFLPTSDQNWWDTWWGFSPAFFCGILRTMGFHQCNVTFHRQLNFGVLEDLFTVVATRNENSFTAQPIAFELSCPITGLRARTGELLKVPIAIINIGDAPLSSFTSPPALLSYHWSSRTAELSVHDGLRTLLPRTLYKGDRENVVMSVRAPAEPGSYSLEITVVEENLRWHEDERAGLPIRIDTIVGR